MRTLADFDPSLKVEGDIATQLPNGCGTVILYNKTNISLTLTMVNGETELLPAWWSRTFHLTGFNNTLIHWKQRYVLNMGGSPISVVIGVSYDPSDKAPEINQPIPILANVGNVISTTSGGGTLSVSNIGNPGGTAIVTGQVVGSPQNNILIDNDGTIHVIVLSVNAYKEVITVVPGTATVAASVLFHGVADTAENATTATTATTATRANTLNSGANLPTGFLGKSAAGDIIDASSGTVTKHNTTNVHEFDINGVGVAQVKSDGIHMLQNFSLFLSDGSFTHVGYWFVGGGTTTITHNFGVQPVFVGVTLAGNFGVAPNQPPAYYGENSTDVHVVVQTGYSAKVMILA